MSEMIIWPRTKQAIMFNRALIYSYVNYLAKDIGCHEYENLSSWADSHTITIPDIGKIKFIYWFKDRDKVYIEFEKPNNRIGFKDYSFFKNGDIEEALLQYANGQVNINHTFNRLCEIRGHR